MTGPPPARRDWAGGPVTAVIDLEAARAMSEVIDQIHSEDGYSELAMPFDDLPADEKVRRLRMVTAVGDVYLRGVR
jgi:hypothetical protein